MGCTEKDRWIRCTFAKNFYDAELSADLVERADNSGSEDFCDRTGIRYLGNHNFTSSAQCFAIVVAVVGL